MDAHLVGYGSSSDEERTSKKRGMEAQKVGLNVLMFSLICLVVAVVFCTSFSALLG